MRLEDADDGLRRFREVGGLVLRLWDADRRFDFNDMRFSRLLMDEHRQDWHVEKARERRRSGRPYRRVSEEFHPNRVFFIVDALIHQEIYEIALPHAAVKGTRLVGVNDAHGAVFFRELVPRLELLALYEGRERRGAVMSHTYAEKLPVAAVQRHEYAAFSAI